MISKSARNLVGHYDAISWTISRAVCADCEGECWRASGRLTHDLPGTLKTMSILFLEHQTHARAARLVAMAAMEWAGHVDRNEAHLWLLEHQDQLDLDIS